MKLTIILLLSTTLSFAQKVDNKYYYKYNDNLEFRLLRKVERKRISFSSGYTTYLAPKGQKFVVLSLQFKKKSNKTEDIDFEKISLITNNSTRINLLYVLESGIVINNFSKRQKKMKANKKSKFYALEFQPINKEDFIKYIVIYGNPVELKLKE